MEEVRYLISDAAAKVNVEAHVLRYWEDELELPISRTQLGHRYYTEEDIQTFRNIKELKERGFQLKAIKVLLPELRRKEMKKGENTVLQMGEKLAQTAAAREDAPQKPDCAGKACKDEAVREPEQNGAEQEEGAKEEQILPGKGTKELLEMDIDLDKLARFESIMENVFRQTLQDNNQELENRISDSVLNGMDARMQIQEEKEEVRYRKLDEAIRMHQKKGRFVAAAREKQPDAAKKKRFFFF